MEGPKRMIYIQEVAYTCDTQEELVEQLLRLGILHPKGPEEDEFFEPADLQLIRRASRLNRTFGINAEGIDIIFHMREQIEILLDRLRSAEQQLEHYRRKENKGRIIEIEGED